MSIKSNKHDQLLSWKTRWVLRRNRVLGSEGFQRWASKMPIFRGVARRRAAAQFDLIAGFVYTQILYVFVKAGLIEYLRFDLRTSDEIAKSAGLSDDATDRLLRAGQALQIVESPQSGLWTLGETGAPLSANPGAMAMIDHHAMLYRDMADPFALLKQQGGEESELSQYWTYAVGEKDAEPNDSAGYSALMAATQPMVYGQILDGYKFAGHKRMLDIGGGSGAFVEAVGAIAPDLELGIFDLPEVEPHCRARLEKTPIKDRVTIHRGSFKADKIPEDYDLITLVRILHDHDDPVAEALVRSVYESLPEGGKLLVIEPMAETKSAPAMGDAYFGLYLWAMGSGRPRPFNENVQMLEKAGFSQIKENKTPLPIIARAIVATR